MMATVEHEGEHPTGIAAIRVLLMTGLWGVNFNQLMQKAAENWSGLSATDPCELTMMLAPPAFGL